LLEALRRAPIQVSEIDAQRSLPIAALLGAGARFTPGMPWKYSSINRALIDRSVTRGAKRLRPDVVIQLADLMTPTTPPTFCYQDMNFDVALSYRDEVGAELVTTFPVSRANLERLADRQRARYEHMDGVLAWSGWFADWLTERCQVDPAKVHVVGAGINHLAPRSGAVDHDRPRTRLLFVGGDFVRKGGDVVIDAVEQLRGAGVGELTLTVAGRGPWPLAAPPPDWVDYTGDVSGSPVADLYASHDLFVMPSRFEAYGVAVLEAQAAGMPVVTRRAFAFPELVQEGRTGVLIDTFDAAHTAEAIASALGDEELFASAAAAAPEVVRNHGWEAVTKRILDAVRPTAGVTSDV
jgi:glycosyltransferase involved in cell wall biosynthesis